MDKPKSTKNDNLHKTLLNKLKLVNYYCVLIPNKGIVAKDDLPVLFHKYTVLTKEYKGADDEKHISKVSAVQSLADENNGTVKRADKALKYIRKLSKSIPKEAYILGKIERRFI